MIFLKYDKDTLNVSFTHNFPFHPDYGLGMTKDELEHEGVLIESIPIPEKKEGLNSVMKYEPNTKNVFFEYLEVPKTEEEKIKQMESELATSKADNVSNMLAITELYEMILGGGA